ncbi:hypothetical protein DYH09_09800 [bacterium CPR1]|nr:hypothetical protein [bacterium CPR1]
MSEFSVRCLEALAEQHLGHCVSIGGALGLFHYLDYRNTHDVDVWWSSSLSSEEPARVIATIHKALASYGEVRERRWGDVTSLELLQGRKKVFSFQIARRSAQLEPPQPAPWVDVNLDSLTDLVASKMAALVERGAPRDFRDLYSLCQAGLVDPGQCWKLWSRRQVAAGAEADFQRAALAVETHLTRIEDYRPLSSIQAPSDLQQARSVRKWFREVFLNAAR